MISSRALGYSIDESGASVSDTFASIAPNLVRIASDFYARGWMLGTSGNLSAVVDREPLSLAMTPSGYDKGALSPEQILLIDERAQRIGEFDARPSAESLLHLRIVKERAAGAVLHTHSVWSTILSDAYAGAGGLAIEGYEMLKGLAAIGTHEHTEWLPIIENSQDMIRLADKVGDLLQKHKQAHGFLLRRHGLYAWGNNLAEAKRHVEILEFLLEVVGRTSLIRSNMKTVEI
jgi:methylthioribulose-1-phosphate dehydratase